MKSLRESKRSKKDFLKTRKARFREILILEGQVLFSLIVRF